MSPDNGQHDDVYGGTGQTRTRLPEGSGGDGYGGARRPGRSPSRSLVTVVGVVVLLIAAIAFANRGDDSASGGGGQSGSGPKSSPTTPTGTKPVGSGFAHDEQGVQSAAANYAVQLGSADMFDKAKRDQILQNIIVASRVATFESELDKAYTADFNKNVGLNENGSTPQGYTFVSRTTPIGTKSTTYDSKESTVEVWCSGLLGLAGEQSTKPVTNSWFTITMKLEWSGGDWKIVAHSQKDGPAPVPGDERASNSDEIAKAVEGYGGFTYAR
ncbi:hypothetical protein OKJ48_07055 [Streptomyces kunmingensis]|uniref:DUF8175 domain-containing protein n=1 Tax=Streptomyces kunmingensis TaxID=68225 RepID=A0ABU6C5L7_9ACTN|nr:hypothetical protein [Streptomyces kunmingensis]MEB3960010.1 hypothetical protein [Streptomyces kunmingensis]